MKNRALQPIAQIASLGKALSFNSPVRTPTGKYPPKFICSFQHFPCVFLLRRFRPGFAFHSSLRVPDLGRSVLFAQRPQRFHSCCIPKLQCQVAFP